MLLKCYLYILLFLYRVFGNFICSQQHSPSDAEVRMYVFIILKNMYFFFDASIDTTQITHLHFLRSFCSTFKSLNAIQLINCRIAIISQTATPL